VEEEKVQIKIPAEVAKIMGKWGGHSVRLAAARGALPMSGPNLVMVLFVFFNGDNDELRTEASETLKTLPAQILLSALAQAELHPAIIDFIIHLRYHDNVVMQAATTHRMVSMKSLQFLAEKASGDVLEFLSHNDDVLRKADSIRVALINNPNSSRSLKVRLGWVEPDKTPKFASEKKEEENEKESETEASTTDNFEEEKNEESLSKYELLQEMSVSEKIKMALTGDKEWRTLLIRESNKQVNTAVLKNPRITEGEVLNIAKNRTSSDDMIRIILLNREWVKIYDMKKALVVHPRTPLQQAVRFMSFLSDKDIREIAKSRNVTQAIVNNARRIASTKKR
jgi:hypothetical protein